MNWVILTKQGCVWCDKAKELMDKKIGDYTEMDIFSSTGLMSFLKASGLNTVPQIFQDGHLIGGYKDLEALFDPFTD